MNEDILISLPSLIHRIGGEKTKQAKAIAQQCYCELKRVRRSRNWGVSGEAMNVQGFAERLKTHHDDGFRYLIQKVETALLAHGDKLEPLETKLARLIIDNPNITLAKLIQVTQCSIAEARLARFNSDI
jgi:hypothetical protein